MALATRKAKEPFKRVALQPRAAFVAKPLAFVKKTPKENTNRVSFPPVTTAFATEDVWALTHHDKKPANNSESLKEIVQKLFPRICIKDKAELESACQIAAITLRAVFPALATARSLDTATQRFGATVAVGPVLPCIRREPEDKQPPANKQEQGREWCTETEQFINRSLLAAVNVRWTQ